MRAKTPTIAVAAAFAVLIAAGASSAHVVTECGNDVGFGYWLKGGAVYDGESKWRDETVTKSRFSLTIDEYGYDIISYDLDRKDDVWSARKSSGAVEFIRGFGADMVVVIGKMVVSTYIFRIDGHGYGEVAYSVARANGSVNKAAAMRAECRPPGRW